MGNQNSNCEKLCKDLLQQLVNTSHFKEREIRKIYKQFSKASTNGSLTRSQFVGLYHTLTSSDFNINLLAEHMFRVFAKRNDYAVEFDEFVKCLSVTTRGTLSEQIDWTFHLYDIDGDNVIEMKEIVEIMKAANLNEESSELLKIFVKMDKNGDGSLSLEEFTNESLNDLTFLRLIGMQKQRSGSKDFG